MVKQVSVASLFVDGRDHDLPAGVEDLDCVKLNWLPTEFVVGTPLSKPLEIVDKTFGDSFRLACPKDSFHSGSVGRSPNVRTLPIERISDLLRRVGDVVREEEVLLFSDF